MNNLDIQIEIIDHLDKPQVIIKTDAMSTFVKDILNSLESVNSVHPQKIMVKEDDRDIILNLKEVLFCESVEGIIYIHTPENIYKLRQSLAEFEKSLPEYFARISRAAVANLAKVQEINRNLHGSSLMKFTESNKQTTVSRRFYKPVKNQLFTYIFNNQKEKK